MNIYGLKKKRERITQHLNKSKDKKVSKSHIDEQKAAIATINKKIRTIKMEREKQHATR